MTYQTDWNIGDEVVAKDPRYKAEHFIIGQTRISTLIDDPTRHVVEHRSITPGKNGGWEGGKWYPEKWILGRV